MAKNVKVMACEVVPNDYITIAGDAYKVELVRSVQRAGNALCRAIYMERQKEPKILVSLTMLHSDPITVSRD